LSRIFRGEAWVPKRDEKLKKQPPLYMKTTKRKIIKKKLVLGKNKNSKTVAPKPKKLGVTYLKNVPQYLEAMFVSLPCNIYSLNRDLVYLWCNDNAAKFFNLKSRDDILGKTREDFKKIFPWMTNLLDEWQSLDSQVIKTGEPMLNVENGPYMLPDGRPTYHIVHRIPLFDHENNLTGIVVIAMDVSDRKKHEELQKQQGISETTSRFMQMLAGSIAHELRTPLAIIGINADLLQSTPALNKLDKHEKEILSKYFNAIKHAVKLSSHIIDNMLVVLKTLASGVKVKNTFKNLSMADGLSKTLQTYPFLDHEKSLVTINPSELNDFMYQGDQVLTENMLANLIRNALHAIREAEKGKIIITFSKNAKFNILKITDTALGISEKAISKIFDQFASNKQLGAGLGLAYCKEVMQVYGGDIICKSKLGEYTEFTLKFPKLSS
jgi:signal transduction histidine kinase